MRINVIDCPRKILLRKREGDSLCAISHKFITQFLISNGLFLYKLSMLVCLNVLEVEENNYRVR